MGLEDSDLLDDGDGVGGGGKASSLISCSICLEAVTDNGDRSWAKLHCGHQFHLDCIGSAFNVKGVMQCPNCRKIEKGQWLFANGCRSIPEFNMDDWAHDEDLYDLSYSEMSFGVHWCPFSGLTRVPSLDEGEFSSTAYHDLLGQQAIFAEHAAVSSATHPCPYIAYIGPVHPSSSNSNASVTEGPPTYNNQWNSQSSSNEMPTSYAFPTMDVHYHSWEHHSSPFATTSSRLGVAEQSSSIPSMSQRATRTTSDMPRSGSYVHPFVVGQSSAARAPSTVGSSMIPPYPGSVARARDRVQALQAYFQQPSNSPPMRTPVVSGSRRSSSHNRAGGIGQAGPVASSSDQGRGGFYFFPSSGSSTGRNYQEAENQMSNPFHHAWEREQQQQQQHMSSFPVSQVDRDQVWGPFHQPSSGGSDNSVRSSSYRQRHGSERMPSQSHHHHRS